MPGSLKPADRTARRVGFVLLSLSTATLLTNAYYLQLLEPTVPRKTLSLGLIALTGAWFFIARYGLPGTKEELRAFLGRAGVPIALAAIVLVGFSLRYDGIESGLPQSYIPDEYEYVHSYLQMIKRGDMNPRWWHHPSVQPYVNVATYLIVYYLEAPTGRWNSVHQMQVEDMLFWGRFGAGVVPGTLSILVVFLLGRYLFNSRVGLSGAALFAVAPGVVEIGQYNKPDSLLVLFSTVSVLVTLVYLDRGGGRLAFAAGAGVGIAVAVKYNAALLLIPLCAAIAFRRGLGILTSHDLYLGALGSVVAFIVGCPYFYADLARFLDHVGAGLYNYGFLGLAGADGTDNWVTHANYTRSYGMRLPGAVAGVAGLALALYRVANRKDSGRVLVFLLYPVLYYSFYSSQRINFAGNLMPFYPFLSILAALAIVEGASYAAALLSRVERFNLNLSLSRSALRFKAVEAVALIGVLLFVLWAPLSTTLRRNRLVTLPDTGSMAGQWIDTHIAPGTHLAVERHTPVLDRDRYEITERKRVIDIGVGHHREAGVEYLVVSSTSYRRFSPDHRQSRRYERLFEACPIVKEIEPEAGKLFGPTIRILAVPPAETD